MQQRRQNIVMLFNAHEKYSAHYLSHSMPHMLLARNRYMPTWVILLPFAPFCVREPRLQAKPATKKQGVEFGQWERTKPLWSVKVIFSNLSLVVELMPL